MRNLITLSVIVCLSFATFAFQNTVFIPAEASKSLKNVKLLSTNETTDFNFTGHYSGFRYQYNDNKDGIIKTYTYEMELTQNGNIVEGTTTIRSTTGDEFATMKVRGLIVINTLHFEEFEVVSEKRAPLMLWCFKSGQLSLGKNGKNPVVFGPTNSFTTEYYFPCSGGYTVLKKDNSVNTINTESTTETKVESLVSVFPNPCTDYTNVSFNLTESSNVTLQIMNLEGNLMNTSFNGNIEAGSHTQRLETAPLPAGVYVVVLEINGERSSRQLIKTGY